MLDLLCLIYFACFPMCVVVFVFEITVSKLWVLPWLKSLI